VHTAFLKKDLKKIVPNSIQIPGLC